LAMGEDQSKRQKAYREYVRSGRDKGDQEIRDRMNRGVIGAEEFRRRIEREGVDARRPKRGRPQK
jgi:hypothetical protein